MALYHGCYNPPRCVSQPKSTFDEGSAKTIRVVVATRKEQKIKGHYLACNWHLYLI